MKLLIILLLTVMLAACGQETISKDLYDDTIQLYTEIHDNKRTDKELTEDQKRLFSQYENKYTEVNKTEREIMDRLVIFRERYEAYLSGEEKLSSEEDLEIQYYNAGSDLMELVHESEFKDEE